MKLLFMIITVMMFNSVKAQVQTCGTEYCYFIGVKKNYDSACGGQNDIEFTIWNKNSYDTYDIKMFVQKKNGEWKDLGVHMNLRPKQAVDSFWSCDLSGKFVVYYRKSGSGESFPTLKEFNGYH